MRDGRARAVWGGAFFALSLLAVFRAPEYHLWLLALLATEWGHWLAFPALLPFAPGWRRTPDGRLGAALGAAAAVLLLTPLMRAERAFGNPERLDRSLPQAFGSVPPRARPGAAARPAPLVWADLWRGVPTPAVRESAEVYSRGRGEALLLQLYRPQEAAGLLPVLIVVHGGSWRSGDRFEMPELSRYLAARGYAVASIDYRLAPGATFPAPVEDVRDAAAFLKAHAAAWSLDLSRTALLGRSAGAQIALAAAAAGAVPGLKGVVDFYGPNDMRLAWALPGNPWILDTRTLLREYMGGSPAEFPKRYDEASALFRVGKDFPPTLMIHGERDELVWPMHEVRLSARLSELGVPHEYLRIPWGTHGCDYMFSGPCGQATTYAVERFLADVLR